MKVNFKEFPLFTSIKRDVTEKVDISEVLANTIYMNVSGVVAHSLAMRIYEQGEVELNEKEIEVLNKVAEGFSCSVADSIKAVINV